MEGLSQLHGAIGSALLAGSVSLAAVAAFAAASAHPPAWLDRLRVALAAVVVAEGAIGVALALRGAGPSEALHWLYGAALLAVPLGVGSMGPSIPVRYRSGALAVGALGMALLAWRLASTG